MLVDVDGTLCDVRRAQHPPPCRWHESAELRRVPSGVDRLLAARPRVALAARARELGYRVVVVSARGARWSFVTTVWLREHGIEHDELVLRDRTDLRPDHEAKTDIGRLLSTRSRVALAVDDREDIREVWWTFGIPVALVDDDGIIGAPSPALEAADADAALRAAVVEAAQCTPANQITLPA